MAKTPRCPKCGSTHTTTTLSSDLKNGVGKVTEFLLGNAFGSIKTEKEFLCVDCEHTWTDKDNRLPKAKSNPNRTVSSTRIGTSEDRRMVLNVIAECENRKGTVDEKSALKTEPRVLKSELQNYGIYLSISKLSGVNTYKGLIDLIISEGLHKFIILPEKSSTPKPQTANTTKIEPPAPTVKKPEAKPKQKEKCPIFVSYKRKDYDVVKQIVDEIEDRLGVKCWIDLDGIESSVQFEYVICDAIDNADIVLFMHSKHHLDIDFEEDWTVKELGYARDSEKRVLLIKLDDTELRKIFKLNYGRKNNIDINVPEQKEKLFRDLGEWLNVEVKAPESRNPVQETPENPQATPEPPSTQASEISEQQFQEAVAILYGDRAKTDSLKAFTLLKRAAEAGHIYAMYELGRSYEFGRGIKKNMEKAVDWYEKAADADVPKAQLKMGYLLMQGEYVEKDEETALDYLNRAEETGDTDAMLALGDCYRLGLGVEKDGEAAVVWYQKAIDKGNVEAMYWLGFCYSCGIGVEEDEDIATEWYLKAAKHGNSDAMVAVGDRIEDKKEAFNWYKKAADLGNAEAMCELGNSYLLGEGVVENDQKAFEWYSRSSELGNGNAMFNLGLLYQAGRGVEENESIAFEWFAKAADLGDDDAMVKLGDCYMYGWGVEKDGKVAVLWYQKAADLENADAYCELGKCYLFGWGVEENEKYAIKLFTKAAEMNNDEAMYELGDCYANGYGVSKNKSTAREWYTKAAELGNESAKEALKKL